MSEDERAIRNLVETWMTASRAGDVETVLGLMSDDAVFMVPGREPFGKEAFKAASEGMRDIQIDGKSDIREIKVLGEWAYLRNHIVMLGAEMEDYKTVLADFDVTLVGVFAPLALLEERECQREDRMIGLARWQYDRVHADMKYDLEIDTSTDTPAACARRIKEILGL